MSITPLAIFAVIVRVAFSWDAAADPGVIDAPSGMALIPAGEFTMGARDDDALARADERPAHRVHVDAFYMDVAEVSNAQFAAFVAATGYVTTAEKPVDWEQLKQQVPAGTPKPADEMLRPGSLVFTPPTAAVALTNPAAWWTWTPGANWRQPGGPGTSIAGKENEPVVHVSWDDAMAYCAWAGRRLPTEAEWEYAARGGLDAKINTWGDESVDGTRANVWQGEFPWRSAAGERGGDGFTGAAPVKRFPPNAYGLYDMAGNVWEWCQDLYDVDAYAAAATARASAAATSPLAPHAQPPACHDPRNPLATTSRVQRGGSFLCHDSYCASYRVSARMGSPADTSLQHLGFRTVISLAAWERLERSISEHVQPK